MPQDTPREEMPIEELLAMMRADSKGDPTLALVLDNFHKRLKEVEQSSSMLQRRSLGQMRVGGGAH